MAGNMPTAGHPHPSQPHWQAWHIPKMASLTFHGIKSAPSFIKLWSQPSFSDISHHSSMAALNFNLGLAAKLVFRNHFWNREHVQCAVSTMPNLIKNFQGICRSRAKASILADAVTLMFGMGTLLMESLVWHGACLPWWSEEMKALKSKS